jgi:PST family polysaccharide transporter
VSISPVVQTSDSIGAGDGSAPETVRPGEARAPEHFGTNHLLTDIGERAVAGGLVTGAAQGAKFVLNLLSAVILARLLSPEQFGLLGMVLAITSLLAIFNDAGLSTATVQREAITHAQVSNLFWVNVGLSSMMAAICAALAFPVAWFYGDSRLTPIMLMLSLTFVLTGSTVQHQALLRRQMRFKAIATIDVLSLLLGFIVGCSLALLGLGYWALVWMHVVLAASGLVLTWSASQWRPSLPTRGTGLLPMLRFGAHLTISDTIARFAKATDSILIGRFFGANALGFYSRAAVLFARPLDQLLEPLGAVLVPLLSRLQADPVKYRTTFVLVYDTLALVSVSFGAMCFVLAEPIVLLLLGEDWLATAPLFAAFTLSALTVPVTIAVSWLFRSQGRGRDMFRTYTILSCIVVVAYAVGIRWGPLGVILGFVVSGMFVRLPVLFHSAGRSGPVRTVDLWSGLLWHLPCWVAVFGGATLGRDLVAESSPLIQLSVAIPLGCATGAICLLVLNRPRQSMLRTWSLVHKALVSRAVPTFGR